MYIIPSIMDLKWASLSTIYYQTKTFSWLVHWFKLPKQITAGKWILVTSCRLFTDWLILVTHKKITIFIIIILYDRLYLVVCYLYMNLQFFPHFSHLITSQMYKCGKKLWREFCSPFNNVNEQPVVLGYTHLAMVWLLDRCQFVTWQTQPLSLFSRTIVLLFYYQFTIFDRRSYTCDGYR